jgi:hypothetical protein
VLLATEVEALALTVGEPDVRAEDVGVVEEAGEDDEVDEVVSETDAAEALTDTAGVMVPPSVTEGTMS